MELIFWLLYLTDALFSLIQRVMRTLDKIVPYISRHVCTLSTANLNHLINGYIRKGNLSGARKLFDQNPTSRNTVLWNKMISAYIQNDEPQNAQNLFDEMPERDIVSWNTAVSGLRKIKNPEGVYFCFLEMRKTGLKPNEFTLSILISALLDTVFNVLIPQVHASAISLALNSSVVVGSALMRGYVNVGDRVALGKVFDEISMKDVTSWNALVLGYMDLGDTDEAQRVFGLMPEKNVVSWTTLVKGYIGDGKISAARSVFDRMTERNVVSWTVMISGYARNGKFMDALRLFLLMLKSGTQPNHFTFSSVLEACAGCSSLILGQQVHLNILKSGIPNDVILSTSLVDMYAKCGDIEAAFCIFQSMPKKNLVSWNSLIGGYARHGLGTRALEEFERMKRVGIWPDHVTFVNVLSGCAHAGLVEQGEREFKAMETEFGIRAGVEHYACMVDLFGRAGQLQKAEELIKAMPVEPDVVVWGALLGGCGLHSNLEVTTFAADGICRLEEDHPVVSSTLLKIHGEKEVWGSNVFKLKKMKECSRRKQRAGSWIESSHVVR